MVNMTVKNFTHAAGLCILIFSVICTIIIYIQMLKPVSLKPTKPVEWYPVNKPVYMMGGNQSSQMDSFVPVSETADGITKHEKDLRTIMALDYEDSGPGVKSDGNSGKGQRLRRGSIPRIIHQIWNDEFLPSNFVDNVKGLVRDNPFPEWTYVFWTKESGTKLVREKFPKLLKPFLSNTTSHILRSDMLRYLVIHQYGGVYFDLDTVSVKPLRPFVETHECALGLEPGEHLFIQRTNFMLTNGALFCVANHPFYKVILFHLHKLHEKCKDAFKCTGPPFLSRLYKQFNKTHEDHDDIPDIESSKLFQDQYDIKMQNKFVLRKCSKKMYRKLEPYQRTICDQWIERGREKRNISEKAFTIHTWYHVINKGKLDLSQRNHVLKVVPHAKIYGENWKF